MGASVDGRLELFAVSRDGEIWNRGQPATEDPSVPWTGWRSLGRKPGGFVELAVASDAVARVVLVAISQSGSDVWSASQTAPDAARRTRHARWPGRPSEPLPRR